MIARRLGLLGVLSAVLLAGVPVGAADTRPLTHAMALDSVAAQVAENLLSRAALPPGRVVRLAEHVTGDTLGVVTRQLVQRLTAANVSVRLDGYGGPRMPGAMRWSGDGRDGGTPELDAGTLDLALQVDGASVSYLRAARRFPFGVSGYDRLVTIRASGTLVDQGTGEVLWTRTATGRLEDRVSKRDLGYVASGSGGINPPIPRGSGLRILEPLIVVGVVTGLIVLFYSNRT